ncbi:hypothetical protein A6F57_19660 [Alteromonas stellipolaris]|uniref:hypothetical protein n=1 Tax=Alteromonas stellipolaris TaxID=233316 RepID=UPI0007B44EEF|nr:hypothetical protein [Alteromonas stellipolaris]ANB27199.1 hypothetical protein A6F57_19660 [Alteromonas stellipolaris]
MRPHNDIFQQGNDSCFRGRKEVIRKPSKQESQKACSVRRKIKMIEMGRSLGLTPADLGAE